VFVHRWTIHPGTDADLTTAHRAAAAYWQWRVQVWPQGEQADIHDLLEARHHLHSAGDDDQAGQLTEFICTQLDTWGAWDHEYALIQETREWLGAEHPREPAYLHQLGILAQDRGDYPAAETWYRQSLTINERLGNQAGMATTWSQLGLLRAAQDRLMEAISFHVQALVVRIQLGVPHAGIDVQQLVKLRTKLGSRSFDKAVGKALGAEDVARFLDMLERYDSNGI
jgi:tetratricopeptide (TPR) repeat protein